MSPTLGPGRAEHTGASTPFRASWWPQERARTATSSGSSVSAGTLGECRRSRPRRPRRARPPGGRAVRPAQAGRDRAQGAEQAAVRAHPARQHQRRGARHRRAGRDPAAGRGRPAAHRRRRAARRGRPGAGRAHVAERVRDVPGIVTVAQPLRVAKTPEAVVAAAVALTGGQAGPFAVRAASQGQAFPADLRAARRAGRPGDPGGARAGGQPVPPGHHGVHRGRQRRGVRVHRGPARARAGCRWG